MSFQNRIVVFAAPLNYSNFELAYDLTNDLAHMEQAKES